MARQGDFGKVGPGSTGQWLKQCSLHLPILPFHLPPPSPFSRKREEERGGGGERERMRIWLIPVCYMIFYLKVYLFFFFRNKYLLFCYFTLRT